MERGTVKLDWQQRFDEPLRQARLEPGRVSESPIRVVTGENLTALHCLADELRGRVTLAYLDPPFLTGKPHVRITRRRDSKSGEIVRSATPAFDDRWRSLSHYLDALAPRLERAFACLSDDGSLLLHVDSKTSHYAKVLCDGLFGPERFASEIIWRYRRWPAKTPNFQRIHDVLLRYTRQALGCKFNQLYEPLAASTLHTWGTRKQRAVVDAGGRRTRSSSTTVESPGTPLGDVWEIGIVAPVAKERTGYPTQKPEALLERLILALTDPGDLVLDPYAGSGTSLVVAAKLGRRAVGIDQSEEAAAVMKQRLEAASIVAAEQRLDCGTEASLAS